MDRADPKPDGDTSYIDSLRKRIRRMREDGPSNEPVSLQQLAKEPSSNQVRSITPTGGSIEGHGRLVTLRHVSTDSCGAFEVPRPLGVLPPPGVPLEEPGHFPGSLPSWKPSPFAEHSRPRQTQDTYEVGPTITLSAAVETSETDRRSTLQLDSLTPRGELDYYREAETIPGYSPSIQLYPHSKILISEGHRQRFREVIELFWHNIKSERKSRKLLTFIDFDLCMCGADKHSAVPSIVVFCQPTSIKLLQSILLSKGMRFQFHNTFQAPSFLRSSATLRPEQQHRFNLYFWRGNRVRTLLHSHEQITMNYEYSSISDYGLIGSGPAKFSRLESVHEPDYFTRLSTISALIRIGERWCAVATKHGILADHRLVPSLSSNTRDVWSTEDDENNQDDEENDHSKEVIEDEVEYDDFGSLDATPTPDSIEEDTWSSPTRLQISTTMLFRNEIDKGTLEEIDLDWSLLNGKSLKFSLSFYHTSHTLGKSVALCHPGTLRRVHIMVNRPDSYIDGLLQPGSVMLGGINGQGQSIMWAVRVTRGGKKGMIVFRDRWLIEMFSELRKGDSGSRVVDTETGTIYGHVVAINPVGEVYISPFAGILAQIQEDFPRDKIGIHADSFSNGYGNTLVVSDWKMPEELRIRPPRLFVWTNGIPDNRPTSEQSLPLSSIMPLQFQVAENSSVGPSKPFLQWLDGSLWKEIADKEIVQSAVRDARPSKADGNIKGERAEESHDLGQLPSHPSQHIMRKTELYEDDPDKDIQKEENPLEQVPEDDRKGVQSSKGKGRAVSPDAEPFYNIFYPTEVDFVPPKSTTTIECMNQLGHWVVVPFQISFDNARPRIFASIAMDQLGLTLKHKNEGPRRVKTSMGTVNVIGTIDLQLRLNEATVYLRNVYVMNSKAKSPRCGLFMSVASATRLQYESTNPRGERLPDIPADSLEGQFKEGLKEYKVLGRSRTPSPGAVDTSDSGRSSHRSFES